MKYSNTKLDFTDAIIKAIQMFNQPKSILEARTVMTVNANKIPSTLSNFL